MKHEAFSDGTTRVDEEALLLERSRLACRALAPRSAKLLSLNRTLIDQARRGDDAVRLAPLAHDIDDEIR